MQEARSLNLQLNPLKCRSCENFEKIESLKLHSVRCNVRKFRDMFFLFYCCPLCHSINIVDSSDLAFFYKDYTFSKIELNFQYRLAYANRVKLLKKFGFNKKSKILDYGCGGGAFVKYLTEQGYKNVYGFDKYSRNFDQTEVLQKKFDYIVAYDVIEHFDQPEEMLSQISNSFNEGGCLVLGTPNAEALDLARPEEYLMELHAPYHRVIFSAKSLDNLCQKYNFKMEYKNTKFYMDLPLPFLNFRFINKYVKRTGNDIDVAVEKPHLDKILSSPQLIFLGFFGYWYPIHTNMNLVFRKLSKN